MTKSLEQIQKENRKFILEAIHGCSYEEALLLHVEGLLEDVKYKSIGSHINVLPTPSIAINIKV